MNVSRQTGWSTESNLLYQILNQLSRLKVSGGGGNFIPLTGTLVGVPVTGDIQLANTDPLARGITSTEDYSANITNLDYTQKIYVDTAIQNQISQSNVGNKLYLFYSFS